LESTEHSRIQAGRTLQIFTGYSTSHVFYASGPSAGEEITKSEKKQAEIEPKASKLEIVLLGLWAIVGKRSE
jgi:hypothetical protein